MLELSDDNSLRTEFNLDEEVDIHQEGQDKSVASTHYESDIATEHIQQPEDITPHLIKSAQIILDCKNVDLEELSVANKSNSPISCLRKRQLDIKYCIKSISKRSLRANSDSCLLINILSSIFMGEFIDMPPGTHLKAYEEHILRAILKKKCPSFFAQEFEVKSCSLRELQQNIMRSSSKRQEEKYKLCLKRGLKYLLVKMKNDMQLHGVCKTNLEAIFYKYYLEGETTDTFCAFNPNTVNMKYIKKLLSFPRLRRELLYFISHEFEELYSSEEIIPKLTRLIDTCQELAISINISSFSSLLSSNVIENPKFKLPWTRGEISDAKTSVLRLVQKLAKKKIDESRMKVKQR